MINDKNIEFEEAMELLNCYDDTVTTAALESSILEDINEEVHCSKFLELINGNNNTEI